MRTVAILSVFALLLPAAARAQEPPAAGQQEALARLLQAQLLRIEALEARLAALQAEVRDLRAQPVAPAQPPAAAPAPVPKDQNVLVQHAVAGEPPEDAIPEGPADDLPRIRSVDAYGSLRVAAAMDSDGNREIRNNSSRLGLRGEKKLTDTITAFGRAEVGLNLVANDRVILGGRRPRSADRAGQPGRLEPARIRRSRDPYRRVLLGQAVVGLLRRRRVHRPIPDLGRVGVRRLRGGHRRRDRGHWPC